MNAKIIAYTCAGRGGHCTTGVALKRDIELHMDAEKKRGVALERTYTSIWTLRERLLGKRRDVTHVLMASS